MLLCIRYIYDINGISCSLSSKYLHKETWGISLLFYGSNIFLLSRSACNLTDGILCSHTKACSKFENVFCKTKYHNVLL